ncbi:I78 family peptidase inhibitor [Paracoccus sp. S1E-3]|uniref:I78 family peptidase inhibitor n=1 Tax=Paracoccus sp. S1E-3 TaxID=2756130 RepID=UPI0015EF720C|nr:I78 family peptidase inhibitor [Paracoccus sp. S1E-3]MBA4489852.1 hypothetical protein [Paracoccus sp. S1E-3]
MTMTRKSGLMLSVLAPLALAACTETTEVVLPDAEVVTDPNDACGAAAYQQYVGQKSPQISLASGTVFRHYRTGDPITMDLLPTRINFEYDRTGTLVKVSCG